MSTPDVTDPDDDEREADGLGGALSGLVIRASGLRGAVESVESRVEH